MSEATKSINEWITLATIILGAIFTLALFWVNSSEDHIYIKETVKPYIEESKSEKKLKDFQYDQIIKSLEEIKTDLKTIKGKNK